MLKILRKNTKAIIWTVVIAFILGGGYSLGDYFQDVLSGGNNQFRAAGSVFGKEISFQEFNRFYRAGELFTPSDKPIEDPDVLRQTAWQGLIFSREAKHQKMEVSDEEVRKNILELLNRINIPVDNYEPWLERNIRMTPKDFESQIREVLRIQKLMEHLRKSVTNTIVTEDYARKEFLRENKQISVEALAFKDQKEAAEFRRIIKKSKDWKKASEPKKSEIRNVGKVAVEVLPTLFQISLEDAEKLYSLEIGAVSEPLASGPQVSVFHVVDKTYADEKRFEAEKETYIKSLTDQKIQMGLVEKTQEIFTRAKLKDYQTPQESPS